MNRGNRLNLSRWILISFVLLIGFSNVLAKNVVYENAYTNTYGEEVEFSYENIPDMYIPESEVSYSGDDINTYGVGHGIAMIVSPNVEGVTVKIIHSGAEAIDKLRIVGEAIGNTEVFTIKPIKQRDEVTTKNVPIGISYFSLKLPMTSCDMEYKITAYGIEEGQPVVLRSANASLKYNESQLMEWHPGTFATCTQTVDYHFYKHSKEIGAPHLMSYLIKASVQRAEIEKSLLDLSAINKYYITTPDGKIPSTKFQLYGSQRYLMWTNNEHRILSFGGVF